MNIRLFSYCAALCATSALVPHVAHAQSKDSTTTTASHYEEIWIREAIGDPSQTAGMMGCSMHSFMPNLFPFVVIAVEIAVAQPGNLSQVRLVGYDSGSIVHPDQWSFTVLLWSDPSIPLDPSMRRTGDLGNVTFQSPPRTFWGAGPPGESTYEYVFDVSGMQALLEPGHSYVLGVTMNSYPGSDGVFTLSTSQISIAGDQWFLPNVILPLTCGSGTAALSVSVSAAASPPGDMNCDGVVSVSDIAPFVLALTDPAAYATQFPNCSIDSADLNGDNAVSVGDIGPFVALLTS